MANYSVVILAAGLGTRMKSKQSKVLHKVAGQAMLSYPVQIAKKLKAKSICLVTRPGQKDVKDFAKEWGLDVVHQHEPLGTAHAVQASSKVLRNFKGYVLILSGDVPLLTEATLKTLIKKVEKSKALLGLVTMQLEDGAAYGRVVRDLDGKVVRVVEAKGANAEILSIREVNGGI